MIHSEVELIRNVLGSRGKKALHMDGFTPAAVLFPLFYKSDELHILLTKRTQYVKDHKGQISFPGGMAEKGDKNKLETALRESYEEVGIRDKDVTVLGELDDIFTLTRYIVSSFVGLIPHPYNLRMNRKEIAQILEVPVKAFLNCPDVKVESDMEFSGQPYEVYYFYYGPHEIWGATARIIKQFLCLVYDWRVPK